MAPLYDFACSCGHHFECRAKSPEAQPPCPNCGLNDTHRVPSCSAAVVFRGPGWTPRG